MQNVSRCNLRRHVVGFLKETSSNTGRWEIKGELCDDKEMNTMYLFAYSFKVIQRKECSPTTRYMSCNRKLQFRAIVALKSPSIYVDFERN